VLGGSFNSFGGNMQSSPRTFSGDPTFERNYSGFRVSSLAPIPEPSAYAAILGLFGQCVAIIRRR
jgi:hypothetical protein